MAIMRGTEIPRLRSVAPLGFIGYADTAFMLPVIAAYSKFLGADEALAGLTAGFYAIVALPTSFMMGLVVDIIGRKKSLLLAFFSDCIIVYSYSLVVDPIQLLAVRGLHAIGGSLTFPAILALVADLKETSTGRGVAVVWMAVGISNAAGAILSGLITSTLGFKVVFQVLSVILAIGFVLSFSLPETHERRSTPKKALSEVRKSIGWLTSSYISIFALYYVFGVIVGIASLTLMSEVGMVEEEAVAVTGLYIGLATVSSIGMMYLFGALTDRTGPKIPAVIGLSGAALSQLLLAFSLAWAFILASSLTLGLAIGSILVTSTVVATSVSQTGRGTSMGFHQTMNILGVAMGAPISGLVFKMAGAQLPYLIGALVQLLAMVVVILSLKGYPKAP